MSYNVCSFLFISIRILIVGMIQCVIVSYLYYVVLLGISLGGKYDFRFCFPDNKCNFPYIIWKPSNLQLYKYWSVGRSNCIHHWVWIKHWLDSVEWNIDEWLFIREWVDYLPFNHTFYVRSITFHTRKTMRNHDLLFAELKTRIRKQRKSVFLLIMYEFEDQAINFPFIRNDFTMSSSIQVVAVNQCSNHIRHCIWMPASNPPTHSIRWIEHKTIHKSN